VLADRFATQKAYGYTPPDALHWSYRKRVILQELAAADADFMCLQEVTTDAYQKCFKPELKGEYDGIHDIKSRARTMNHKEAALQVDGCAIFYKTSKWTLLAQQLIEFAPIAINRQDMKGTTDVFDRVMPRDNIAMVGFFESYRTGARVIVVNAHLTWDQVLADVKLVQSGILMERAAELATDWAKWPPLPVGEKTTRLNAVTARAAARAAAAAAAAAATAEGDKDGDGNGSDGGDGKGEGEEAGADSAEDTAEDNKPTDSPVEPAPSQTYRSNTEIPILVCGDFNSTFGSSVYDLMAKGQVPPDHSDIVKYSYGKFTTEGIKHPFDLRDAYGSVRGTMDELPFTNYTPNFTDVIDYIWYSRDSLDIVSLLGPLDSEYLKRIPSFPYYHFPADHIQIMAEFVIKARKDKKAIVAPDFGGGGGGGGGGRRG
jgi:CCR4-NOT transcription complex subunit 6